jgi:multiple sugar transport system permease protein
LVVREPRSTRRGEAPPRGEPAANLIAASRTEGIIEEIDVRVRRAVPALRPKAARHDRNREGVWGYVFISPWIIGLLIFTGIPIVASFVLSLTAYDILRPERIHFVAFANYTWAISDPDTLASILVTLKFAAVTIPLTIGLSLGAATLLHHRLLAGKPLFKTIFFMPAQIPLTASVLMWTAFIVGTGGVPLAWLQSTTGSIGDVLTQVPVLGPFLAQHWPTGWFTDGSWSLPLLLLMGIWGIGNMTLIFLAGLQSVPTAQYEAAQVDGAGRWRTFRSVTLPNISPMMFYSLLLTVIAAAGYFTQAYLLGGPQGGPNQQLLLYNVNLYNVGWNYDAMGRACALAWIMFALMIGVAAVLFRTSSRWVYYAGGDE